MATKGGPIRQLQVQVRALSRREPDRQDTGEASGFHGRLDWPSPKVGGLSTEPRSTQSGAGSASRSRWLPAKCPEAVRDSRTPRALLCVGLPYSARPRSPHATKTSPQSRAKSSGLLKPLAKSLHSWLPVPGPRLRPARPPAHKGGAVPAQVGRRG